MTYSEIIIMRITTLCKKRDISINRLATMCGMRQSTIDNIVRGITKNPRIKTLHRIALGLNMTISEFLDFKEMNEVAFDDESTTEDE